MPTTDLSAGTAVWETMSGSMRLRLRGPVAATSEPIVAARGVGHAFGSTPVLFDVSLDLYAGEIALMTGPSGSGKTTLLTLIGALRSVQSGSLRVGGRELAGLSEAERVEVRRGLGFIFQGHNLFESLTARQNVLLALDLHGGDRRENDRRAREVLEQVGLGKHLDKKPGALSGGQKQRVAVARALASRPPLVLADEPTAALDAVTGRQVVDLLKHLAREQGTATVLVTHDSRILEAADRIINMVDGRLVSDVAVGESLEICEFLIKVPIFAGYTPAALAEIAEQMSVLRLPAGTRVFRQGELGEAFYVVWEGAVEVHYESRDPAPIRLAAGEFFGEMALLTGERRKLSATVAEDAVLLVLDKQEFTTAMEREKSFRDQLRDVFYHRQ
jgi:putative ABC transport system ATP-binding protein